MVLKVSWPYFYIQKLHNIFTYPCCSKYQGTSLCSHNARSWWSVFLSGNPPCWSAYLAAASSLRSAPRCRPPEDHSDTARRCQNYPRKRDQTRVHTLNNFGNEKNYQVWKPPFFFPLKNGLNFLHGHASFMFFRLGMCALMRGEYA